MISFFWNQIYCFESFGKIFHLKSKSTNPMRKWVMNTENFQQNLLPSGKNSPQKENLDWDERM